MTLVGAGGLVWVGSVVGVSVDKAGESVASGVKVGGSCVRLAVGLVVNTGALAVSWATAKVSAAAMVWAACV